MGFDDDKERKYYRLILPDGTIIDDVVAVQCSFGNNLMHCAYFTRENCGSFLCSRMELADDDTTIKCVDRITNGEMPERNEARCLTQTKHR